MTTNTGRYAGSAAGGLGVEDMIVRSFIAPHRRSRWLSSLGSAKRRRRFLDCLNHCADLDSRYARPLPSNVDVVALLRVHGAPAAAYVVSSIASIDGREMPLEEAVAAVELGGWGTIIICIPGRLGCYIDEAGTKRRLLLVRAEATRRAAPDPGFDGILPSDHFVAHRLNGHYDFRGMPSQPGELRSARILESRPLTDEQSAKLRGTVTTKGSFGGEGMRCFTPGVGFTVGSGAETVEILICLRCYWAYFFRGESRMVEALSEVGHRQLAKIYVELFPDLDPNAA